MSNIKNEKHKQCFYYNSLAQDLKVTVVKITAREKQLQRVKRVFDDGKIGQNGFVRYSSKTRILFFGINVNVYAALTD